MNLLSAYLSNPKTRRALSKRPGQQGFSLIELVVVIAVLAILAVIVATNFGDVTGDAAENAIKHALATMYKECEVNKARTGTATHTAMATAAINGATMSGQATATTCTGDATGTPTGGSAISLNLNTGAKSGW
jgi:type IV pilus assembly protein PilA